MNPIRYLLPAAVLFAALHLNAGIPRTILYNGVLKNADGTAIIAEDTSVGLNFRLIDATTSEVLYTKQVESIIKESGLTLAGAGWTGDAVLGGFISSYAKTPIGQAVIAGINKGVYDVIKEIGARPAARC